MEVFGVSFFSFLFFCLFFFGLKHNISTLLPAGPVLRIEPFVDDLRWQVNRSELKELQRRRLTIFTVLSEKIPELARMLKVHLAALHSSEGVSRIGPLVLHSTEVNLLLSLCETFVLLSVCQIFEAKNLEERKLMMSSNHKNAGRDIMRHTGETVPPSYKTWAAVNFLFGKNHTRNSAPFSFGVRSTVLNFD